MDKSKSLKAVYYLTLVLVVASMAVSALGMVDFMFFEKNAYAFFSMLFFFVISLLSFIIVIRKDRSSGILFYIVMFLYMAALLATGIMIPLAVWPGTTLKYVVIALSVLVVVGLIVFNVIWRNYNAARPLISVLVAIEWVIAVLTVTGFSDAGFADFNLILGMAFARPVTLSALALTYIQHHLARNGK